ncbi:hypothetical protein NMG60_11017981 [Bertholletia excelsa]
MDSRPLNAGKEEKQNVFDWLYFQERPQGFFELDPRESTPDWKFQSSIAQFDFNDLEDILGDFSLWDAKFPVLCRDNVNVFDEHLVNPEIITEQFGGGIVKSEASVGSVERAGAGAVMGRRRQGGRAKSGDLEFEEIQKYFDVPITVAAKELNVGLTVLKKRCRELNIMRWPHRKIKSLKSLIHNVKELGLTKEIEMLERQYGRMLEKLPELELTERTKRLRQACFKANYKKRRALAARTS